MRVKLLTLFTLAVCPVHAWGGDEPYRKVRLGRATLTQQAPADLIDPAGRSRWDLSSLVSEHSWERTLMVRAEDGVAVLIDEFATGDGHAPLSFVDPSGGEAAVRWLFPDRDESLTLRPGERATLRFEQERSGSVDRVWVESERVGIGWVHLPSGPREVVLQRALVLREAAGTRGFVPERLIHRWVDPRVGVVAEIGGPVSADGQTRLDVDEVVFLEQVISDAATLKIYIQELEDPAFRDLNYGWNRREICASGGNEGQPCTQDSDCAGASNLCGASVSSLTPDMHATIGDLIAADTWDFSGNTTGTSSSSTTVPINANETCNYNRCGYTPPGGRLLGRRDEDLGGGETHINNQVTERTDDAVDGPTIWLRGGAQRENESGLFGGGESRFCFISAMGCDDDPSLICGSDQDCIDAGRTGPCVQFDRSEDPLWRFPNQDADGWFMQAGDPLWSSAIFSCEQNFYNRTCGAPPLIGSADLWSKACEDHDGNLRAEILKGGVVTLPSGHTLNALLVRNITDVCIYSNTPCRDTFPSQKLDEVRTVVYLWEVPNLGSLVMLQSAQEVPDATSFDKVAVSNFTFGLFPPISIQVDGSTDASFDLSWNPGNDTSRILDYVVYWDEDSGGTSNYAFNSLTHPGQVIFSGTSATISGLGADSDYFLTVTSRSNYTDPLSGDTTTYESILYPTQVSGDPDLVYPVEVQGATECSGDVPGREVEGLTVDKAPGGIEICWQPNSSACLTGYKVLGADSPESDANFNELADLGLVTCWQANPTESYFLSIAKGAGGDGPWGHYGR